VPRNLVGAYKLVGGKICCLHLQSRNASR